MRSDVLGLRLVQWDGEHRDVTARWLRWALPDGTLLPTGAEMAHQERVRAEQERAHAEQERARAEQERARAEQERARAEQERAHAEQEHARAERLAEKLRALGIDPEA